MSLPNRILSKQVWYKKLLCKLLGHSYLPDKQPIVDYEGNVRVGVGRYSICDCCNIKLLTEYKHE